MRRAVVLGLIVALGVMGACSAVPPRSMLPPLPGASSTERPPWLRDLPDHLERYPAPQGWGGDYMASVRTLPDEG
jgi:hypothetical protein